MRTIRTRSLGLANGSCEDARGDADGALEDVLSDDGFPAGQEAEDYASAQVFFRCENVAEAFAETAGIADRIMSTCRAWVDGMLSLPELVSPATAVRGAVTYPDVESPSGTTPILVIVEIVEADFPALIAYTGEGEPESNVGLWSAVNNVTARYIGFPANDLVPEQLDQHVVAADICLDGA